MITSVTIGSLSFNTGTSTGYWLTGTRGLETPPIRLASYDLAGQDYGQFVSAFYGKRRFSLEGMIVASDASDFITKRDNLYTALTISSGPQAISFTLANGRVLSLNAVLVTFDGPPTAGQPTAGQFQAEFEAAFPFPVSTTPHVTTLTLPIGGGTTVPLLAVPASISASSGGSVTLSNAGNAASYPTVRIAGPVTNPGLRNMTSGDELTFTITLASGEYLDIDFQNHTVIDNTARSRYDTKSGDWWTLAPGSTVIRFVADTSDPSAQAVVTYQDAYLGL